MTYLFYDIETTGLNPAFDQIVQFAAIRTDEMLNELSRCEIRIALRSDVLLSPSAAITHQLSPFDLATGVNEVTGIKAIHELLNQPGTISLGYNTLGFDDEFLRFSFYRNLLPVYSHQYAHQCSRMDIFPIIIFYYLFAKNELNWPLYENKLSLKLEALARENNLLCGQAHDAIVDVEMTLALAKILKKNAKVWDYCTGYFNKIIDTERMQRWKLIPPESNTSGIYIESILGQKNQFQAPVMLLGQHRHYKNQWLYLRLDVLELHQVTAENFIDKTWVIRKKMGEPGFFLPNELKYRENLNQEQLMLWQQNEDWLRQNPVLLEKIKHYYLAYKYPVLPEADVDSILYQSGFLSREDEALCRQFHSSDLCQQLKLIEQLSTNDLQELAFRLLGRNYYTELPEKNKCQFDAYLDRVRAQTSSEIAIDYRGEKKLTRDKALTEIAELRQRENLSEAQKRVLDDYSRWLDR